MAVETKAEDKIEGEIRNICEYRYMSTKNVISGRRKIGSHRVCDF